MDRKRFEARLNLARHFFRHTAHRLFSHDDKDGVGLQQFFSNYRADNIFEIEDYERERYPSFARCIQCGICQPYCVMFRAIGYLEFPGPMVVASTLSRVLAELGTTSGVIYNCTLCRLCETTCPENAPISEMARFMRKYIYKYEPELTPGPLKQMCSLVKKRSAIFDEAAPGVEHEKKSAEYVLFLGCHSRFRQKERTQAAFSMLEKLSVDFTTIDEVCCGAPLGASGCGETAELARTNIERILEKNTAKVITLCPHCLVSFYEDREYAARIEAIHIAELLPQLHPAHAGAGIVAYHDPCMLGRACGVYDPPRQALTWAGAKLVEMEAAREKSFCCGNWGGLGQSSRACAETIAVRRLEDARRAGADTLLTECPWCLEIFQSASLPEGKPRIASVIEYLQNPEGIIR
ncbi:MAG: (Fe-S)-binding protein [Candidatus Lindowbacteria bacterium]|nr:(Fe-S)-binding protein [Candidatus Lindowbacteria bacterium]